MNPITYPIKPGQRGKKVKDLQEALLLLIDKKRDIFAPPTPMTHVPRPPRWEEIIKSLKDEHKRQYYGRTTKWLVTNLQHNLHLQPTGEVDKKTAEAINNILKELGFLEEGGKNIVEIYGKIYLEDGRAGKGLTLRFYRHEFGKTEKVAETKTDENGAYKVKIKKDNKALIIEVRVIDKKGKEISISEPIPDLEKQEKVEINLVAPSYVQPLEPEFHRLVNDISNVIKIEEIESAKEDEERQDITFLSRSTTWDARLIALFADAKKMSKELGLPEKGLYALFRVGFPRDRELLVQLNRETVKKALDKASNAGIIDEEAADNFIKSFEAIAQKERINVLIPGSNVTYKELLSQIIDSEEKQKEFISLFFKHANEPEKLWEEAKKIGLTDTQIKNLKLQGKLAYLTEDNAPLIKTLIDKIEDPEKIEELVDEDLYDPKQWEDYLNELAQEENKEIKELIPPAYSDNLSAYAADMALKIRRGYPTQVLARMIEKDNHFGFEEQDKLQIAQVLRQLPEKGFIIGKTPVEKFVRDGNLSEDEKKQIEPVKQHLKALHRVYQMTPNDEAMPVLFKLGMTSASSVTSLTPEQFAQNYEKTYEKIYKKKPPAGEAALIYRKAHFIESTVLDTVSTLKWLENVPPMHVIPFDPSVLGSMKESLIKELPTLETLFGSLDFCECEHCRSVLSPAAYLVDLLHSLERWGDGKAYNVLIERRPDIAYIPLTCENTHTTMPYIDIVNEILEYWVAHNGLTEKAAHDIGSATSEELIAEPQYIEPKAYKTLKKEKYPLNLPFDLWIEMVREFSNYLKVPLWKVIEVFRPTDELFVLYQDIDYGYFDVFMEKLGLSPSEVDMFTYENLEEEWYELYGYESENNVVSELSNAKKLSRRLGITYKELVEILKTHFINPNLHKSPLFAKAKIVPHPVDILPHTPPEFLAPIPAEKIALMVKYKDLLEKDPATLSSNEREIFNKIKPIDTIIRGTVIRNLPIPYDDFIDILRPLNKVIVLAEESEFVTCDFDKTYLKYADLSDIQPVDLLKINLFVRLWKKLGWSIQEVDEALRVFIPQNADNISEQFKTALLYLSHLKTLEEKLKLGKDERIKILTFWSDIPTTGENSLYAQLFLKPDVLNSDKIFDDPLGRYLEDSNDIKDHLPAIQGVLGLTEEEIGLILKDNGQFLYGDENNSHPPAVLNINNLSLLYRHSILAKALKVSVSELIDFKKISGINPFGSISQNPITTLEDDAPYQTIRFIETFEKVKESGFKIEDLNYLLRHKFDPVGKYRLDEDELRFFLKTLADGIRSIKEKYIIPEDSSLITEDSLKEKLGVVLPQEVVDRFIAMLKGTAEFTAVKENVSEENKLNPDTFKDDTKIVNVSYDPVTGKQSLTFKGILFEDKKQKLIEKYQEEKYKLTENQLNIFSDLLDDIKNQAKEFFETYFVVLIGEEPPAGFFKKEDYGWIFGFPFSVDWSEVQTSDSSSVDTAKIKNVLSQRNIDLTPSAKITEVGNTWQIEDENRVITIQKVEDTAHFSFNSKRFIAENIYPIIQKKEIADFVSGTLAEKLEAEKSTVEVLISNEKGLSVSENETLLDTFKSLAQKGVTVTIKDSAGNEEKTIVEDVNTALLDIEDAQKITFEGYFSVPTSGAYRFYVSEIQNVKECTLEINNQKVVVKESDESEKNEEKAGEKSGHVPLKANIPYHFRFELTLKNAGNENNENIQVLVRSEDLPKGELKRLSLYPSEEMKNSVKAFILLKKVLQIFNTLEFKGGEIKFALNNKQIFNNLDLNKIPVETEITEAELFPPFMALINYALLKKEIAPNTEDLAGVLGAEEEEFYEKFAELTRRNQQVVRSAIEVLFENYSEFEEDKLNNLSRLWEALQIVERFGVSPDKFEDWRKIVSRRKEEEGNREENEENEENKENGKDFYYRLAYSVRDAVRARFDRDTWLKVIQPISDRLRKKKRDALVAYVMRELGFDRIEQLYEYFLIDPGMEPVVWTSRIRLAIASVQLFIQRCLLNLEKEVHPSAINTREWEWMKNYRVWEANRKIFLWPENWLEPEFRDDKSNIFQELEGKLLQGDLSDEMVEDAFLGYLKNLDELARLDIVAMHLEYKENAEDNVLHVFGRTFNQPHKYFYRRYSYGVWTPWEPVNIQIQGDFIAPVVWNDRLWLFWVTFMEKPVLESNNKTPREMADTPATTKKELHAQLHWSIYDKGKWSPPQASEFVPLYTMEEIESYYNLKQSPFDYSVWADPSKAFIYIHQEQDDPGIYIALYLPVKCATYEYSGVDSKLEKKEFDSPYPVNCSFYMAGRNAVPESKEPPERDEPNIFISYNPSKKKITRYVTSTNEQLGRIFAENPFEELPPHDVILGSLKHYNLLLPNNALYNSPHIDTAPFFYQDDQHTFFVEPGYEEVEIPFIRGWVLEPTKIDDRLKNWLDKTEYVPAIPDIEIAIPPVVEIPESPIDPRSRFRISKPLDPVTYPNTVIDYGGKAIGKNGMVSMPAKEFGAVTAGYSIIGREGILSSGIGITNILRREIR